MREAIGRPVRVTSISFAVGETLPAIAALVDEEGARGVDLIILPETWLGQDGHVPETLEGPTVTTMAALARTHRTWIVCPIDRRDGQRRLNSAVLLDRSGTVAAVYDKLFPYQKELEAVPPVRAGGKATVLKTDFGVIGMAICFDANFPELWQDMERQGAEIVVWPSEYAGGTTVQAHALVNHYYVVTATQAKHCLVYDITGREALSERSATVTISRFVLDLDRGIYHEDFNLGRLQRLLDDHADDVEVEARFLPEKWFVLRARRPGVSARNLAREYGLEELRAYIARNRREREAMRRRE
jgi:predicted amidohydrolase